VRVVGGLQPVGIGCTHFGEEKTRMILDYYKLAEQPFGVTPDPRFLFLTPTHREALASVLYGARAGRGFTALIAKPGMGKTTLLFDFLNKVKDGSKTAYLFQPQYTPQDLLRSLLADLGIEDDGADFVGMHRKLIDCLMSESKQGKQLVVVVDEAQNLDEPALELLRMLSNFETPREKMMHLILVGQPQLAEKLASPRLTQLRQRISIIARLEPLSLEETHQYIDHRLRVAGSGFAGPLFTKQAKAMITEHAEGIPRNINNLCFNAMSLGCALKKRKIDVDVLEEVIRDLDLHTLYSGPDSSPKSEEPKPPLPNTFSTVPRQTSRETWALRFALALVLMALIAGIFIRTSRPVDRLFASVAPPTVARTANTPKIAAVAPNVALSAPVIPVAPVKKSSLATGPKTVQVLLSQTLYRIMMDNLGSYDENTLKKIRDLNPWLSDPALIRVGQTILLPGGTDRRSMAPPTVTRASATMGGAGMDKP
jgi:type II secretory pathway predicted ATPase ExeA